MVIDNIQDLDLLTGTQNNVEDQEGKHKIPIFWKIVFDIKVLICVFHFMILYDFAALVYFDYIRLTCKKKLKLHKTKNQRGIFI